MASPPLLAPSPFPMDPPPVWGLPRELSMEIAQYVRCSGDVAAMVEALGVNFLPPRRRRATQPPLLVLPDRSVPDVALSAPCEATFVCFCCGGRQGREHRLRVRADAAHGRMFGAYGGWMMMACEQTSGHAIVNLYTRTRLLLPDTLVLDSDASNSMEPRRIIVMLAATLSAGPLSADRDCFAAAIVHVDGHGSLGSGNKPVFALWMLDEAARHQRPVAQGFRVNLPAMEGRVVLEDVSYMNGAFYFLTSNEDVLVVRVERDGQRLIPHQQLIQHRREQEAVLKQLHWDDEEEVSRYLMVSRGGLLMVLRRRLVNSRRAFQFSFYSEVEEIDPDSNDPARKWLEIPDDILPERLVYLARGCSKAVEIKDLPSGLNLKAAVFYMDDSDSGNLSVITAEADARWYRCHDNGKVRQGGYTPLYTNLAPSNCSPPMWFFP